jgi:hypothetical protein
MQVLNTIDTASNPKALCVLSPSDNGHLAFPTDAIRGEIVLYDANNLSVLNAVQAHRGAPVALAFNSLGTLLATASETVILVPIIFFSHISREQYCVCLKFQVEKRKQRFDVDHILLRFIVLRLIHLRPFSVAQVTLGLFISFRWQKWKVLALDRIYHQ